MKIQMTVSDLKDIFDACKKYVSKDKNHPPIYQTVKLTCEDGFCTACASDGYKMIEMSVMYEGDDGVLHVPITPLPKQQIVTLSDEGDEIVFAFLTEKQTFRKIEGEITTDRLFPTKESFYDIYFNPKILYEALSAFSKDDVIKLSFRGVLEGCEIRGGNKKVLVTPIKSNREFK